MIFFKKFNYQGFNPQDFLDFLPEVSATETMMTTYVCNKDDYKEINRVLNIPYKIYSGLYFCIQPQGFNSIHIDSILGATNYPTIALNIPLVDCDKTIMYWYESVDKSKETFMRGPTKGDPVPKLTFDNAITLKETPFDVPTFIRIDKWHNVKNYNTDTCAKMLSVRFRHPGYFEGEI